MKRPLLALVALRPDGHIRRPPRIALALCVAPALIVLFLALGTGLSAAAVHGCRDVTFIGARGSGEPLQKKKAGRMVTVFHGVGEPLDYMAEELGTDITDYDETMAILPVIYPADSIDELIPSKVEAAALVSAATKSIGVAKLIYEHSNLKPYEASIANGVKQTIADVHAVLGLCPESELVLAGYSQGGMAVHQAELQLQREGDEEALDAIGGTLLLGDGDRVPDTQARIFGGAPARGEGIQVYFGRFKPVDVVEPETTAEICIQGDVVCDFGFHLSIPWYSTGKRIHTTYMQDPRERAVLTQAVAWLAEEMGLTE